MSIATVRRFVILSVLSVTSVAKFVCYRLPARELGLRGGCAETGGFAQVGGLGGRFPGELRFAAAEVAVGAEVFNTTDLEQPCGTVVQVAAAPGGGFDTIVSLQISATQEGSLQVGADNGAALALLPLPYPLLEDI